MYGININLAEKIILMELKKFKLWVIFRL
jgi:hypothetical protein